jgi:hypothetical protein
LKKSLKKKDKEVAGNKKPSYLCVPLAREANSQKDCDTECGVKIE